MPDEQIGQELEQDVQSEVTTEETPAELPEDVNERTKEQFEKLKQHNQELAEKVKMLESQPPQQSALESLQPKQQQMGAAIAPNLTQQQVDDIAKGLVDENGYLDQALLENVLRKADKNVAEAKAEATQARLEARQAVQAVNQYEITRETRIAHKKFPNVDPKSKTFDPEFFRLVKNQLLGSMYEGKKLSFTDACQEISKTYSPKKDEGAVKAKAVEEYKENVAKKSALNITGKSRPETKTSQDDLVEGTRKGDAASIAARLANI